MLLSLVIYILLIGLFALLFLAAMYFARGQTTHQTRYHSWSDMLGSRNGAGKIMDANEQLLKTIGSSRGRRRKHSR